MFGQLCDANLTLNLAKCEFGQAIVPYLGKIVCWGQFKPVHLKAEPSCRSVLLLSVVRCAVFGGWSGTREVFRCQRAFDCVNAFLTHLPVLATPAFDCPFKFWADAIDAGGMLYRVEHLVSYLSGINVCILSLKRRCLILCWPSSILKFISLLRVLPIVSCTLVIILSCSLTKCERQIKG